MMDENHLAVLTRLDGITAEQHINRKKAYCWMENRTSMTIGFYSPDGSTSGEFNIAFRDMAGSIHLKMVIFGDAFNALINMPELLIWLGKHADGATPTQLKAALDEMGFMEWNRMKLDVLIGRNIP